MSHSPTDKDDIANANTYLTNWSSLGEMISLGASFSGRERNRCFLNLNGRDFADVSFVTGLDLIDDGRGIASVDWDHDGDLDLWFSNRTGPRVRMLRNASSTDHHFLSIRLQGRTCNRDAIGTRVELHIDDKNKRIKTLRAGEGFLSQSSKWIHFGLGQADRIEKVVVHWPGAESPQVFEGLDINQRYLITQNAELAKKQANRDPKVLETSAASAGISNDASATFLTQRLPIKSLSYRESLESSDLLELERGKLSLVNLWASWCQPCVQELADLAKHHSRLEDLGLNIYALSIEDLDGAGSDEAKRAVDFLRQHELPFTTGFATNEAILALTELDHNVFYRKSDLPLPCSFLFDESRRLIAIYKGTVSAEQLLNDVTLSQSPTNEQLVAAFPFPGVQVAPNFNPTAYGMAEAFLEGDYLDDARREIFKYIKEIGEVSDFDQLAKTILSNMTDQHPQRTTDGQPTEKFKSILQAQQVQAKIKAFELLLKVEQRRGSLENEAKVLTELVRLQPKNHQTLADLAVVFFMIGDQHKFGLMMQQLTDRSEKQPSIAQLIGETYMKTGDSSKAIPYFQHLKEKQPENLGNRFNLAMALQVSSDFKRSAEEYRSLLAENQNLPQVRNNLAWLLATASDESVRSPKEAVELASLLCKDDGYRTPSYVDTLAKTHEVMANRTEALKFLKRARELAYAQGDHELSRKLTERIDVLR